MYFYILQLSFLQKGWTYILSKIASEDVLRRQAEGDQGGLVFGSSPLVSSPWSPPYNSWYGESTIIYKGF